MARRFLTLRMRAMARKRRSASSAFSTALLAELARRRDGAPEAAQDLLVEERRRGPDRALVDDEAHGVRADVDDADRLELRISAPPAEQLCQARHEGFLISPFAAG